ncbi:unnamed protein product [Cochlearia groenlandica]
MSSSIPLIYHVGGIKEPRRELKNIEVVKLLRRRAVIFLIGKVLQNLKTLNDTLNLGDSAVCESTLARPSALVSHKKIPSRRAEMALPTPMKPKAAVTDQSRLPDIIAINTTPCDLDSVYVPLVSVTEDVLRGT